MDIFCPSEVLKHGMSIKNDRIHKIKSFLRMQSGPVTVTEIHEALSKRMHLDISRKTIERDMIEMVETKVVTVISGVPSKFTLNKPTDIELVLKVEEIQIILKHLEPTSEIYQKLQKNLPI